MDKRDLIDALRQKEYEDSTIKRGDHFTKIESIILIIFLIGVLSNKINIFTLLIAAIPVYFILRILWQFSPVNTILAIICSIIWGMFLSAFSTLVITNSIFQTICLIIGFIISIFFHRNYIKCLNKINIE